MCTCKQDIKGAGLIQNFYLDKDIKMGPIKELRVALLCLLLIVFFNDLKSQLTVATQMCDDMDKLFMVLDSMPVKSSDDLVLVFIYKGGGKSTIDRIILEGDIYYPYELPKKKYLINITVGDTLILRSPWAGAGDGWYDLISESDNFRVLLLKADRENSKKLIEINDEIWETWEEGNYNKYSIDEIINQLNKKYILKQWKLDLDYLNKNNWILKYP